MFTAQTWIVLLGPAAVLCTIALVRRTWAWRHTVAFLAGGLVVEVAIDFWTVCVLGQMDEKFRRAPMAALELRLMGTGVFSALRAVLFLIGLLLVERWRPLQPITRGWLFSLAGGALAALGEAALYSVLGEAGFYAAIAWVWILAFPLFWARVLRGSGPLASGPLRRAG